MSITLQFKEINKIVVPKNSGTGNCLKIVSSLRNETIWRKPFTITYSGGTSVTYTISFSANGGSGSAPSSITGTYNLTKTLPGQGSMTRLNYNFVGWGTTSSGGTVYPSNGSYTITGSVTLYALWTVGSGYSLSFNANGGTGSMATLTGKLANEMVILPLNTFERSGYNFTKWYEDNNSSLPYDDGDNFRMPSSNVTMYAQWQAVPVSPTYYTITFDVNGGVAPSSWTSNTRSVAAGAALGAAPASPSRSSYTFSKWNTNASGTGMDYNASAICTSSLTFYAIWTSSVPSTTTTTGNPVAYFENMCFAALKDSGSPAGDDARDRAVENVLCDIRDFETKHPNLVSHGGKCYFYNSSATKFRITVTSHWNVNFTGIHLQLRLVGLKSMDAVGGSFTNKLWNFVGDEAYRLSRIDGTTTTLVFPSSTDWYSGNKVWLFFAGSSGSNWSSTVAEKFTYKEDSVTTNDDKAKKANAISIIPDTTITITWSN